MRELKRSIWPYKIITKRKSVDEIDEIVLWLRRNFGVFSKQWIYFSGRDNEVVFYFKDGKDATAFNLTWT